MINNLVWHDLSSADSVIKAGTSVEHGLSTEEAASRKIKYGLNVLSQKKSLNLLSLFLAQFNQPLVYILLASAAITAFLHEWIDASVIFGVVLVNAIIGFMQESKALKAIDALAKSITTEATVIRDGNKQRITADQLTLGDIVLLQSGDRVPADLRLIQVRELQIDESALTGESVPVIKQTEAIAADTVLADRINMAYSSTLVTYGTATGIVIAIGNETEVGNINKLISSADVLTTPLTKKIGEFSALLLYVIIGLALITFVVGILRGEKIFEMFMAVVALAVGAIPEGLPARLLLL